MEPRQLAELPSEMFRDLLLLCLKYPPRITDTRKNSGTGRTQPYGIINRIKGGRGIGLGMNCEKYPKIWDQGQKLAQQILPDAINWTTFMLNMNYEATRHVDKNNDGESLVVAFGDYTGGELVVVNADGTETEYNIRYRPVVMDASKYTHYVKPVQSGARYSIIFFRTGFHKKFYDKYGKTLTLYDLIDLLPEKLPGQKNSELRIPV